MIAKGHDIPNVTLVGVINGGHRAGRAGFPRGGAHLPVADAGGRARRARHLLPGDRCWCRRSTRTITRSAARRSRIIEDSTRRSSQFRRLMRYPPFSALANVLVRADEAGGRPADERRIWRSCSSRRRSMKVLGPAEAPVPRLKNEFRYQLLIKARCRPDAQQDAAAAAAACARGEVAGNGAGGGCRSIESAVKTEATREAVRIQHRQPDCRPVVLRDGGATRGPDAGDLPGGALGVQRGGDRRARAGRGRRCSRASTRPRSISGALVRGWNFYACEDLLDARTARRLDDLLDPLGLVRILDAPGMEAMELERRCTRRRTRFEPVADEQERQAFTALISAAFHIPYPTARVLYEPEERWRRPRCRPGWAIPMASR